MATHSSILAWKIPWRSLVGYSPWGCKESDTTEWLPFHFLKGLVGLHRTIQLQLLQCYWLGHRLGLLWYWMVCLRDEQRSFRHFWDCIQVLHFGLFCWPGWLLHFFWRIPASSSRYNGHLSYIHPFQYILVHWFLKCWCSLLLSPVWPLILCLDSGT